MPTPILSIDDLHVRCKERVALDKTEFGIESVYLPNPIFTEKPKYCLVAQEPTIRNKTLKQFEGLVNQGLRNFLCNPEDFILRYCANKFLSQELFSYYITDLSKGAMDSDNAKIESKNKYVAWRNILQQELEFFGNPKLIAIGGKVEAFLKNANFQVGFIVLHMSRNNAPRFRKHYNEHPDNQHLAKNLHIHLKKFAIAILENQEYHPTLQNSIVNKLFNEELTEWYKGMFLYYKDKFAAIS